MTGTLDQGPLAALCRFKIVDGDATFMGNVVRVDKACTLVSVHDVIVTLEECSQDCARQLKKRLTVAGIITEGINDFKKFEIGKYKILGARLHTIAHLCFFLKGQAAGAIVKNVYKAGLQYLAGEKQNEISAQNFNFCMTKKSPGIKEKLVRNYVELECVFKDYVWIFNKSLDSTSTGSYRPDALLRMKTHAIVLEVDQDQHKDYNAIKDNLRTVKIQAKLGVPVVFIRFNPDNYHDKNGVCQMLWKLNESGVFAPTDSVAWSDRLKTLKDLITVHARTTPTELVTEAHLFFDARVTFKH
jgi:hypothetical protein